jgi:hypothetical protein
MRCKTSSYQRTSIWNIFQLRNRLLVLKNQSCSLILGVTFAISVCGAEFNSIYRQRDIGSKTLLISQDAKQRTVLRVQRPVSRYGQTQWVTCVEPPPDFASVLAAAASGTFSSPSGVAAGLTGSSAESGGTIGLRTQSIQLLRDSAYRICEGFANGAVSDLDYAQLLRRNQVMLTAVLAIEQLTGAVTGPALAVGASGSTEVNEEAVAKAEKELADRKAAVGVAQGKVEAARLAVGEVQKNIKTTTDEITKFEAIISDPAADAAAKDKATKDLAAARKVLADQESDRQNKQRALAEAQGALEGAQEAERSAQTGLNLARLPAARTETAQSVTGPNVVSKDIPQVASAVRDIVSMAFAKQHILDLCQMYWSGLITTALANPSTSGASSAYLDLRSACNGVLTSWLASMANAEAGGEGAPPGGGSSIPYSIIRPHP